MDESVTIPPDTLEWMKSVARRGVDGIDVDYTTRDVELYFKGFADGQTNMMASILEILNVEYHIGDEDDAES